MFAFVQAGTSAGGGGAPKTTMTFFEHKYPDRVAMSYAWFQCTNYQNADHDSDHSLPHNAPYKTPDDYADSFPKTTRRFFGRIFFWTDICLSLGQIFVLIICQLKVRQISCHIACCVRFFFFFFFPFFFLSFSTEGTTSRILFCLL